MDWNYGISTMVFYQNPLKKLLPHLSKQNIRTIEIRPHIGHFELQDPRSIDELKKNLDDYKISVKAIHMPLDDVDISQLENYDRTKSVREVEKTIMAAVRLGAELVITHPGGKCSKTGDREKRVGYCIDSLREILDFSQQQANFPIKLALENTPPGRLGDSWEEIQQIITKIASSNLGICFDTGHYLLNQTKGSKEELNLDKQPIDWHKDLLHVHVHDNDGKKDLHLLPGEGKFPWSLLMHYLDKINYQGTLIIEPKQQYDLPAYLDKAIQVFHKLDAYSLS